MQSVNKKTDKEKEKEPEAKKPLLASKPKVSSFNSLLSVIIINNVHFYI